MTKAEVEVKMAHPKGETEPGRCRIPPADVYETADAYVLLLDLPGVEKEGISLTLEKGEMRVRAAVGENAGTQGRHLFGETRPATFARSFTLGEGIDTNSVDAQYDKGVLTVKLYKHEGVKPREISIN
jgi:HSP20 family protein